MRDLVSLPHARRSLGVLPARMTGLHGRFLTASQIYLPGVKVKANSLHPHKRGDYKHYRLEVNSANQDGIVRISEMQLFTRASACQEPDSLQESMVDTNLLKSLASAPNTMPVKLVGTVKESGLSAPPSGCNEHSIIFIIHLGNPGNFPINVDFNFLKASRSSAMHFKLH